MMKRYEYTHADRCKVGLMKCCSCGKKITGQYRYHETEHAYVPCHRECCSTDKTWAVLDQRDKEEKEWRDGYEQACKDFLEQWGSFPEQTCDYCGG